MEFNCNAIESQAMWYFIDPHELTGRQRGLVTNSCPEVFLSLCFTLSTSELCLCSLALGTFLVLHWRLWTLSDTALLFIHSIGFLFPENPRLGLLFYYVLQFLSTVAYFSPISFPASFPLITWILLSAYWFLNFLRCTLPLIFLYLIWCYWSPNVYYRFWMFWGRLGWAGFSAYS